MSDLKTKKIEALKERRAQFKSFESQTKVSERSERASLEEDENTSHY